MAKLTMQSIVKCGKNANKKVCNIVNVKGEVFSMIKEGYEFDDEVLEAAGIKKIVREEKVYCRAGGDGCDTREKPLPKESASVRQIISELNTIDTIEKECECTEYADDGNVCCCRENNFDNNEFVDEEEY